MLLVNALDEVDDRFGDFMVTFASLLDKERAEKKGGHVISPAWKMEYRRKIKALSERTGLLFFQKA